jgi:hypothetical protein
MNEVMVSGVTSCWFITKPLVNCTRRSTSDSQMNPFVTDATIDAMPCEALRREYYALYIPAYQIFLKRFYLDPMGNSASPTVTTE